MSQVYLNALGISCALGSGPRQVAARLFAGHSPGMRVGERYSPGRALPCAEVTDPLPSVAHQPPALRSRNNRLLLHALRQVREPLDAAMDRHGAGRVAAVVGTSTSGIAEGEAAIARLEGSGAFPAAYRYAQQ